MVDIHLNYLMEDFSFNKEEKLRSHVDILMNVYVLINLLELYLR